MITLTIIRHNFNTTLKQTKVHGTSLVIIYKTHTQDSIDRNNSNDVLFEDTVHNFVDCVDL